MLCEHERAPILEREREGDTPPLSLYPSLSIFSNGFRKRVLRPVHLEMLTRVARARGDLVHIGRPRALRACGGFP